MDDLLEMSEDRYSELDHSCKVPRRQGMDGNAAGEDGSRLACDHLERWDHEEQTGYD